jgi:hypothetical protein
MTEIEQIADDLTSKLEDTSKEMTPRMKELYLLLQENLIGIRDRLYP